MNNLFNLPQRNTKAGDLSLINKVNKPKAKTTVSVKGGQGLMGQIATITALVKQNLGQYEEDYLVIRDEESLAKYVDACIEVGEVAIDTETTGLNPLSDEIVGFSLYTPGQKAVYVPLHHKSYITLEEVNNQMPVEGAKAQLQRMVDNKVKFIFFNAKFDIRVVYHRLGVKINPYFCGFVACRLLNENEPEANLKALHKKYVLNGEGDAFRFDNLFKGVSFDVVPINTGYVYAAHDALITYELYQFQIKYLTKGTEECRLQELEGVCNVFWNIEMPLIQYVAEMEDTGIALDFDYAYQLSEKYNAMLAEKELEFIKIACTYEAKIKAYRDKQGYNCKLSDPINISSPTQIAILLYDIIGVEVVDKKNPRGTGEEIVSKIDIPLTKCLLEYRGIKKLLSTYIDKMPAIADTKTKRVYASFNQNGTDTGRFSSSEPNMQNIPSHNKDIRKMFKATDGYVMISSDYSAQEPRLMAHLSQDAQMIKAYLDGKDLYVEIAAIAFDKTYEECLEFNPDGSKNPEGKERRGIAKAIVLGVAFGKGIPAIAKDLNISVEKAQKIYDRIMKEFPGLKKLMEDSERFAREKGYVETFWGRKRRLPNINLEPYVFMYTDAKKVENFDPFFDTDMTQVEVDPQMVRLYTSKMNKARGQDERKSIIWQAKEREGILIIDNTGKIAEAVRQCVNSRVQGSAADQTKIAMLLIGRNQRLRELGFRLLLPVHDELIGECPLENAKEASELFRNLMIEAAKELSIPSKCDVEITDRWYGAEVDLS